MDAPETNPDPGSTNEPANTAAPAQAPAAAAAQTQPAQATQATEPRQQQLPDFERDPLARAMLDKARAEEVAKLRAEAEADRASERTALEAKLRAEAEAKQAEAEAERKRVEELSATDRMQEQIAELAKKDAEREISRKAAEEKLTAATERLEFVRGFTDAGHRLAKQDAKLEDLAHAKAKELLASGKTMAEAIASLAESDSYLFAAPAAAAEPLPVTTAAGSSAPRGSTNQARPPSQPANDDAWARSKDEFTAFMARKGWLDLVSKSDGQVH